MSASQLNNRQRTQSTSPAQEAAQNVQRRTSSVSRSDLPVHNAYDVMTLSDEPSHRADFILAITPSIADT